MQCMAKCDCSESEQYDCRAQTFKAFMPEPMFKTLCPKMLKSGQKLTKIDQKMSKMIQIWSNNY